MNKLKKNVTVRFFSVEAEDLFFQEFVSNYQANQKEDNITRITSLRNKKYLIKASAIKSQLQSNIYPVTVVRERNTWQTKATSDGKVTSIATNQGIIGDPYFFFIVPEKKVVLGFTTGPSVSLKSVASSLLEQFSNNRTRNIKLDLISKEKEFSKLTEISDYSSLHFKIGTSSLTDVSDNAPKLIKDISNAPYLEGHMQLSLDFDLESKEDSTFTKENVIEIVNYLSNNDDCTLLKIKGRNTDGSMIHLDFGNAFLIYKTEIVTRQKYVEESSAYSILQRAFEENFSLLKV